MSNMFKKLIILLFLCSITFSQLKENRVSSIKELRTIVEDAYRANQKVWLEDFTGIQ